MDIRAFLCGRFIEDRGTVCTVTQRKRNAVSAQSVDRVNEVFVLFTGECFAGFPVIGNGKMRKDAFGDESRQTAGFECFLQFAVSVPVLEPDSAHAAVNFQMHLHLHAFCRGCF